MADLFALAERLERTGEPFVLATVVRAERPTSAKPGDKAILTERGLIEGWIGGSCAEPTVVSEARAALQDGECRLLHISPEAAPQAGREGLKFVAMTCFSAGTLEIYLEPHLAAPHLAVYGHSPVARALAELARRLKYRVTVIDLRSDAPDDDAVVRDLSRLVDFRPSYAVVATHGVCDEAALEHALGTGAAYVGLVASRKRGQNVRALLGARGLFAERVRSPVGLQLGAQNAEEIALSILAEIVLERRAAARSAASSQPIAAASDAPSCCAGEPQHTAADAARSAHMRPLTGLDFGGQNRHPVAAELAAASCCAGEPQRTAADAARSGQMRPPTGLDFGGQSAAQGDLAEIVSEQRAAARSPASPQSAPAGPATDGSDLEHAADGKPAASRVPIDSARSECCAREVARRSLPSVPGPAASRMERAQASRADTARAADGVEAILLAAGESRRMAGTNKLLIPIDGRPLVRRSAEVLIASGVVRPIVVLGHEAERVREALAGLPLQVVLNPDYRQGQETSVRAGLAALPGELSGVMICLSDQPQLSVEDLREIRRAFVQRSRGSALVPMHRGQRGNPIVLARDGLEQILARGGKFGCRQFTTHHADLVETYEMASDGVVRDLDRPEDVIAWAEGARVGR